MLRIKFLRNILIFSIFLAAVLPLCSVLFIHPAYQQLLIEETEADAVRHAGYLIRDLELKEFSWQPGALPPDLLGEIALLRGDTSLLKFRFFSTDGRILYSTEPEEIGQVNQKDYFRQMVARGKVFSKVVRKDAETADGVVTAIDLVETYVPVMAGGKFIGAIETYYDITASRQKIDALSSRSLGLLVIIFLGLLSGLYLVMEKAKKDLWARESAEEALRRANAELEERVAARTGELLQVNRQLSLEVEERTFAEKALANALAELRADREKIAGIVRSVDEGLLVTDESRCLVMANPAAERLLGLGAWRPGNPFVPMIEDRSLREAFNGLLADGAGAVRQIELLRPGIGTPLVLQAKNSATFDSEGRPGGLITVLHDVTQERAVERLKNEFVSMAAHELQTPLTAVIGYAELLLDREQQFTAEEQQEYLSYIHEKGESLANIVRDLLDIGRFEAERMLPLDKSQFPVTALVPHLVDQYRRRFPRHQFEISLAGQDLLLEADRSRLTQVLENLLSNAVKYSCGGRVCVCGRVVDDAYQISVEDQGIGMTPDQVGRIFEKFYRANHGNTAASGIGLGMSIARYMVESHGGRIWVESELGRGTTVHFTLPLPCLEDLPADVEKLGGASSR